MKRIKNLKKKKQIKVLIVEVGMRVLIKKQHKMNKYLKVEMEDQEEDNLKLKLKKIIKFLMKATGKTKLIIRNKNRNKNQKEEATKMIKINKNLNLTKTNQNGCKIRHQNNPKMLEEEEVIEGIVKIESKMDKAIIKPNQIVGATEEEVIEILTMTVTVIKIDLNITEVKTILDVIAKTITEDKEKEDKEIGEEEIEEEAEEDFVEVLEEIKTDKIMETIKKEVEETLIEEVITMTDRTIGNNSQNHKIINPQICPVRFNLQFMMLYQLLSLKEHNLGLKSVSMLESVKSQ